MKRVWQCKYKTKESLGKGNNYKRKDCCEMNEHWLLQFHLKLDKTIMKIRARNNLLDVILTV